ncbi:MAG: PAS domain S-box protein, partial [Verrucomicrobiales bacterium]|nr:PAS domain S-box protein [Verrucomicrobiales bacterium]
RDRIVFVGARPVVAGFQELRDEYRNPFSSRAGKYVFMPAVEIHATQALNLLRDDDLHRLSPLAETTLLALAGLGIAVPMFRLRLRHAAAVALGIELAILVAVVAAFRLWNLWFPWLVVAAFQAPALFVATGVHQSADWVRHRRRLEAERRAAEETIREQAALLDKAQDAIWVQDLEGRVLYANPAARDLYGWEQETLPGPEGPRDLAARSRDAHREARRRALDTGEWLGELEQETRHRRTVVVQSRWTLIRDAAGNPRSILSINTDITEKKRLEAQFLRAQRMQTVGDLAGGMAHDLNNALSPVLLGSQLLRRDESDAERLRLLELIEMNARRGADMVRQVLLFARGSGGDRTLLDLRPLLRDMERIARQTFPRNLQVSLMAPDDLWTVRANSTELHQVLLNLCVNARDAMPEGGELSLAADNVVLSPEEAAEIPGGRPGEHIMLLVADTGGGIPPEVLPHIFEPFFTTKPAGHGTGLGLATVARIARGHGGFVGVRSEPGTGTSVEVYLPRALPKDTPQTPPPVAPVPLPIGNLRRILVADDERALRDILETALREHGFRVATASDTDEALELLRGAHEPYDGALLDASLPTRDGRRQARSIASEFPHLRVLWMAQDSPTEPLPPGAIRKPFDIEALLRALNATLSGPPHGTDS